MYPMASFPIGKRTFAVTVASDQIRTAKSNTKRIESLALAPVTVFDFMVMIDLE
jgi:hypothetical protein